ncbi:ABC transporter permease [Thomasclavelia spiroformis]|uniref:ABC transporter permease n=1 Tax=Thomasclavelia spiroformis TaxID=29348 RepID=UPI0026DC97DB|nr:ABC transporter permease [Thomasclavelia spiroformis]
MMLFKLSLKNVKKSFSNYAIYFFTLILGISIFYIFNALETQTIMLSLSKSLHEIISMMNNIIAGLSVFVSIILGFLIIYANQLLIKRRKKEFAVYMILGMSKKQISKILLGETITIGFISLMIGLIMGIGLSQVMSIIVANLFEANMNEFVFIFSKSACIKTIIYFGIMYISVILLNTFKINKCKLIDLLYADKKSVKTKIKNPIICVLVFIFSICLLAYAYYNVTIGASNLKDQFSVLLQMFYGATATYLIFWSLSNLLLKIMMLLKNIYFKNLNSFTLKEISSKLNTTVLSTTIICLMLFVTICILSTSFAINNSINTQIDYFTPVDLQIDINGNKSISEYLSKQNIDIKHDLKNILEFKTYTTDQLKIKDTFGSVYNEAREDFLNSTEIIIKLSDYNKLAKLYNLQEYDLKNEYIVVCDFERIKENRNKSLKNKPEIVIGDKKYSSKYDQCMDGFLSMSGGEMNFGFYILPDQAVNDFNISSSYLVANYNVMNENDYDQMILEKLNNLKNENGNVNTRLDIYNGTIGITTMIIFISLYLGIVFLISSAVIIALKELSQNIDNKEKYRLLRKLGTSDKDINHSLFIQILIYFVSPLILAIIHSFFGLQVCKNMLASTTNPLTGNITNSILLTAVILILIYGGYFLFTYYCSKNFIKEE